MKRPPEWAPVELLQSPLFAPLQPILSRLDPNEFPSIAQCNDLLAALAPPITVQRGIALRFVTPTHGHPAFENQYEPRCYLKGEVQMRSNNWHDLLNAVVWLTFPKAKAALNARHYDALSGAPVLTTSQRGATRDMATLFDESGVVVACAKEELASLLRYFQWPMLFWQQRAQVQACMEFYLFGHGLYEKALQPYIGMTGQGLIVMVEQEFFNWPLARRLDYLDDKVAAYLDAPSHCRNTHELCPVPLLGIPGWSAENNCAEYYDNTRYFRTGRREWRQ